MIRSLFCMFSLLAFIVGCGKSDPTGSEGPPPNPIAGPGVNAPTSGNAVFDKSCANCHSVTAPNSGGPPKKGPNLSKVGVTRSSDWLADHVKNPATHKPGSNMPPFQDKLTPEEIKSVSDFMAGLK